MIKTYFKSAWRSIWKNKSTNFINIAGLSIGMTAAVMILLWVQNENNFDNVKDRKNIYRLTTRIPGWVWETTPLLLADAIKSDVPEIEKTTRLNTNNWPVFNVKGTLFYGRKCAYVDNDGSACSTPGLYKVMLFHLMRTHSVLYSPHPNLKNISAIITLWDKRSVLTV